MVKNTNLLIPLLISGAGSPDITSVRLLYLLLATAALAAADSHPSWWNLASPEATALVGIHWENLRESAFAEAIGTELSSEGSLAFPDLPCIANARQILISSPAILAIAYGAFPKGMVQIQALAKGFKSSSYGGVELWIASAKPRSGSPTLSVARMNDQLLLIGSPKTLEAAIDRSQSDTGRFISPLLAQAARFSQTKDLWVVATQLPDPLASLFVPLDTGAKGFEGGVSVKDGLDLEAGLRAGSEREAEDMAEKLRQSIPGWPVVAQGMEVTVDSRAVLLSLQVDREQLLASLRHPEASPVPAPAPEPPPTAVAEALPPPPVPAKQPEGPQIIRILGLDDGPREILLPPAGQNQ